jgi:DNA-binding winged helix-turn-helix (wHTH) protein
MAIYAFGSFELDERRKRLTRGGSAISLSDRNLRVLLSLVEQAGTVVSKDALIAAAWGDVAVTDNSLEQAISAIRRALGAADAGAAQVETVPRQGYRFAGTVTRHAARETDEALEALMQPHRAWLEGRAALETLKRDNIAHARSAFERVVAQLPDLASAHVGLANAAVMEYEATRADHNPDKSNLATAVVHAQEACRLDATMGEAWATLGFVLARVDRIDDALAAARRAVVLEGDNWRHHFRLSSIAWGEERLRAAKRTLGLIAGFSLAHWLAATVHVARNALDEAERELIAGIAAEASEDGPQVRFGGVALHWLLGLILLARGNEEEALREFGRELALEMRGHLYAREACANAFYAIGAVHLRRGRAEAAREAFDQCLTRVPAHGMARIGRALLTQLAHAPAARVTSDPVAAGSSSFERALADATRHLFSGDRAEAVRTVDEALAQAPPGNALWLLPVEPLLCPAADPGLWAAPLARLRARAF